MTYHLDNNEPNIPSDEDVGLAYERDEYEGFDFEDEGIEEPEAQSSEVDIERKYDEGQARILTQRNDFLIPNLLQMVKDREILDVAPTYQRRYRWTDKKKSQLIESLLMNVPIPPIFLYERDLAKYEVMDGQQRITSIRTFFNNEFRLQKLTHWPELNGRYYRDLPPRIQAGLERRGLSAIIILSETSKYPQEAMKIRQYVFERLNVGGQQLNAQEIRNCIFASKFNNMLTRIARSPLFTTVWDIPPKESGEPHVVSRRLLRNRLYATMKDCEIVLRYFTLEDLTSFSGMKTTLDNCMRAMTTASTKQCEQMEQEYTHVLKLAQSIFGPTLFRLLGKKGKLGRYSLPFSDAVMLGLRPWRDSAERLITRASTIRARSQELLADPESYEFVVSRGNTKLDISKRISMMQDLFAEYA